MDKLIVLIPHYNSPKALMATIQSINETFAVDVLVVDDGSEYKPDVTTIEDNYQNQGKIYFEFLEKNQGIEKALNHGLRWIKSSGAYAFIGRLDCGDLAMPTKFAQQVDYLQLNPKIHLLGTWAEVVDESFNHLYNLKHPVDYQSIQKKMYINSCFVHPTVVFRIAVLDTVGYYPENRKSAEDFAYFFKLIKKHQAENLPATLLKYVVAANSISSTKRKQQVKNRIRVICDHFYFGWYPVFGVMRNAVLWFMPRGFGSAVRKFLKVEKLPI